MKVAYYNDTKTVQHIGPVAVRPGSTRAVDERDLPDYKPPEADAPEHSDPILALLDGNVGEIQKAIPGLSDEDLDRLEQAEVDGKTRKGVMEAIAEEKLERSTRSEEGGGEEAGGEEAGGEEAGEE